MSGSIKAGSGEIGGLTITEDTISDINPSGKGIEIKSHPSTPIITIKEDSNNKIEIFNTSANDYGIKGVSTGSTVFRLGKKNQIASKSLSQQPAKCLLQLLPGLPLAPYHLRKLASIY